MALNNNETQAFLEEVSLIKHRINKSNDVVGVVTTLTSRKWISHTVSGRLYTMDDDGESLVSIKNTANRIVNHYAQREINE